MKISKPPTPLAPSAGNLDTSASNSSTLRRYQSGDFFGAAQEIEIEHNGAIYRLRKTSLGKLILTK